MSKEELFTYMANNSPVTNSADESNILMAQKQFNNVGPKIDSGEITTSSQIDAELS